MKQNKTETLQIRLDREMYDVVKQESGRNGMTVTTFIRDAIRDQVTR
jgi:predicted DNA-binding protein